MTTSNVGLIVSLSLVVLGLNWAMAQTSKKEPTGGTFTADDYIEIQQLYHRYGWAIDGTDVGADTPGARPATVAEKAVAAGQAWADCFTPDGVFEWAGRRYEGREELAQFVTDVYARSKGTVRHWYVNLVITPTPEGARGKVYVLAGSASDEGPPRISTAAIYWNDVLVKTPEGWRFKRRTPVYRLS